mgnify:CR=1 FL=1
MLLSLPTRIIHLLTVSEWLAAMVLFERYARAIDSAPLRLFALCMLPHLLAGPGILLFHASGDRWDASLATARTLTFAGIVGTVYGTHGHGECPLFARLRTPAGKAAVCAKGRE